LNIKTKQFLAIFVKIFSGMIKFKKIKDVLAFAIDEEQKIIDLYEDLSLRTNDHKMRMTCQHFVRDGMKQMDYLNELYENKHLDKISLDIITQANLDGSFVPANFDSDMNTSELLTLAIGCENKMRKLYTILASNSLNPEIKTLFKDLSKTERTHQKSVLNVYEEQKKNPEKFR